MKGMIKLKQRIVRTDGVEYERKPKAKNYDASVTIRINSESLNVFKEKAALEDTSYSELLRELIEEYARKLED